MEKLTRPSSVKLGVPSSMKARSVRYMPRYGTHGGLQLHRNRTLALACCDGALSMPAAAVYFFRVSLRFLKRPSDDTIFCSLSISAFVCKTQRAESSRTPGSVGAAALPTPSEPACRL